MIVYVLLQYIYCFRRRYFQVLFATTVYCTYNLCSVFSKVFAFRSWVIYFPWDLKKNSPQSTVSGILIRLNPDLLFGSRSASNPT